MRWITHTSLRHGLAALLLGGSLVYLILGNHKDWGLGIMLIAVIATRLLIVNAARSGGPDTAADESDKSDPHRP